MAITVLVGGQWGDEGKGKIIDVFAERADWVVRYQGGNNAGHTVEAEGKKFVFHLLPSGMLHPRCRCVIGHGVVVDPVALCREMQALTDQGVAFEGRLFISDRCHVVFPYHRLVDEHREAAREGGTRIGTTKRGIGPAYADKAARVGLRIADLVAPDAKARVEAHLNEHSRLLTLLGIPSFDVAAVATEYLRAAARLAPYVADTVSLLHEAADRGEEILLEGAQGTLLDIDFGTYPFVTSSNATAGGACTGTGIPPNRISRVIGVIKAYTTRVGEGPFPTELHDAVGERLRATGREFGATTGRPRRCGWFDVVVARYAAQVNGVDTWAVTKLDVLDGLDPLRICVAYERDGQRLTTIPASGLERCRPIYEELMGWSEPTSGITRPSDLPSAARRYLSRIEELTGRPISIVSLGPQRESLLFMDSADGMR